MLTISRYSFCFSVACFFLVILLMNAQCSIAEKNQGAKVRGQSSHELIEKQKGVHVFGYIDSSAIPVLLDQNYTWVTLVPWGFQKDFDSQIMKHHRGDSIRIKRTNENLLKEVTLLRNAGIKVFIKPHIWLHEPSDGKWRSDVRPTNELNWDLWKESYRDFILRYAKIAEESGAEMFCIGTELTLLSTRKQQYWVDLIREMRSIYTGKLTYAANWYNEYDKVTFWNELDYIGIQAYFPLTENMTPSVKEISVGWNNHIQNIESVHRKYDRPILFTEMGYKSTSSSAIKPWEWVDDITNQDSLYSLETQANCYEAFFNTVWNENWFAGVHIWQIRTKFKLDSTRVNMDFTPQGKPAEAIIAKRFSQSN